MAEPAREQVVTALLAALATISGVRGFGSAYPNEPQVLQALREGEQVNHRPAFYVEEGSGSTFDIEVTAGGQVGYHHRLNLLLFGFVKADATATAQTWRRRLWDDAITTLCAAMTLSGLISVIEFGPLETDEGMLAPEGEFVQPLTLHFHETKTVE